MRSYAGLAEGIYAAPAWLGDVRLVTIDGPSGSGKTTFARRLRKALSTMGSVALVEIEALYDGWTLNGAWQRLDDLVLEPLSAGWEGGFHPYDWASESWSQDWCAVPVCQVLLVEGCGSSDRAADRVTTMRIWVEAPSDVAMRRSLARPGVDLERRLRDWKRLEAAHFAEQETRQRSDVRVNGNPPQLPGYDPEQAFTVDS